jgi:hypothetical protein
MMRVSFAETVTRAQHWNVIKPNIDVISTAEVEDFGLFRPETVIQYMSCSFDMLR